MTKTVHDYRKGGLRFRVYPDGSVTVSSKDLPERSLHQLDCIIWLTGKKFSSICQAMIREGFLDDMLAELARISRERGMKRNAGVELYDALVYVVQQVPALADVAGIKDALKKARGES